MRSLYWRAVLGFSACIAAVLIVQVAAVVLYLKAAPDPAQLRAFSQTVALDLSRAVSDNPSLDVQRYIDEHYASPVATLYITLADGQVIFRGPLRPSDSAISGGKDFYRLNPNSTALPESWATGPYVAAAIMVNGRVFGGVGLVTRQSWRELIGWKMTLLSISLFAVATLVATRFVFGTVVSRIRNLMDAATRCGAGDFSARADTSGHDELSNLGFAFNRMVEDLGRRDEQLKSADRTRRMLLADISHELRTPLTSVRSYRDVLSMSEVGGHPEAVRCLGVIDEETQRLEQLIGDLLDLTRLEAVPNRLTREAVAVEHLFGVVTNRLEPQARARGVALTTSISVGAELLYGDPLRLEQAVQNLAANALRYTSAGGSITMSADVHNHLFVLTVRDTGHGIPTAHLPFVFERFYKVDSARSHDDASGSGLGLSIVKAIIEGHGGTVTVASTPNVETTLTIQLPLDDGARSPFVAA
jgi:signal transduction histidine kinase